MGDNPYTQTTEQIAKLANICEEHNAIEPHLYVDNKVYRGLRDPQGNGVLTGLTEISDVIQFRWEGDKRISIDGILRYRGYDIRDLVGGFMADGRFGFEETVYLLLMGKLPTKEELADFTELLASYRALPTHFVRDIILKAPSPDMMNTLARSVLTMYAYDDRADDISIPNVLRQCMQLISLFPMWSIYGYQSYMYYHDAQSLFIHPPRMDLSTAENMLYMLRADSSYTELEAKILDLCLVLHAEHGGGNNSTFTTHVVSSSGTDTYSAIAAALGSLKGPKHGGANIKVCRMVEDIKQHVRDWNDKDEIRAYLDKILAKEAFDHAGLIYGMGHAVYTISDPREKILESFVAKLSVEKDRTDEFALYRNIAEVAIPLITERRRIYKGVAPNVDFYSGFVYSMLGLPTELFTPIFAIARVAGWSAHRIEGLINADNKIIRPAYMGVCQKHDYVDIKDR
ncbi:MAG: citrate/2-methylcitrate synthase [Clostridia bacterium]|nr:citrate/2-methylcitrate synthase [Clostridia bacterium]